MQASVHRLTDCALGSGHENYMGVVSAGRLGHPPPPAVFPLLAGVRLAFVAPARQVRQASGFLDGQLANEGLRGFWTMTVWSDLGSMRRYRDAAAHRRAMPRLQHWCDEASVIHWEQPSRELPSSSSAVERMVSEGRLTRLRTPSPDHARNVIAAPRFITFGPRLRPVAQRPQTG